MKKLYIVLVIMMAITFPLSACANKPMGTPAITAAAVTPGDPLINAVNDIRMNLGMPDLPLQSNGMDKMMNSPNGDLPVAIYVDSEGRKFSVEPQTNTVVEIDARSLLASVPANVPSISQDELRAKALNIARITTPNFNYLSHSLMDESGSKGDYYFFDLRMPISPNEMMPPFFQIGFDKSGYIFAYINTLSFK